MAVFKPNQKFGNFDSISLSNWNTILSQLNGRAICIIDDEVVLYDNENTANANGHFGLTPQQITEITQRKMKQMGEALEKAEQSSSYLKEKEIVVHSKSSIEKTDLLNENEIERELREATGILRSNSGTDGVYFIVKENGPSRLILKMYNEPRRPIEEAIADKFFQEFGFLTPRYTPIEKTSRIGQAAISKLRTLWDEYTKQSDDRNIAKWKRQFDTNIQASGCKYITAMERVPGKPFEEIVDPKEIEQVFQDPHVLEALGEMIFFDAFIGNCDRLANNDCNPGNFLLVTENEKKKYDAELLNQKKVVALIDHGCGIQGPALFKAAKNKVAKLLDKKEGKKEIEETISNFVISLLPKDERGNAPREKLKEIIPDLSSVTMQIFGGIYKAADDLVEKFSQNPSLINEIIEVPSGEKKFDKDFFDQLINVIKTIRNKGEK